MPKYEYNKLRMRIFEMHHTMRECCKALDLTEMTFRNRMNGISSWTLDEVYTLCSYLLIPIYDIPTYFHNRKANTKGAKQV